MKRLSLLLLALPLHMSSSVYAHTSDFTKTCLLRPIDRDVKNEKRAIATPLAPRDNKKGVYCTCALAPGNEALLEDACVKNNPNALFVTRYEKGQGIGYECWGDNNGPEALPIN